MSTVWAWQHHIQASLLGIIGGACTLKPSPSCTTGMQICAVPSAEGAIQAMVEAMSSDGRHGRNILWEDFKAYMTAEFTAGHNMLNGDYILPTGQAFPFALQIKRLKRWRLMGKVMAGGRDRDDIAKQHEHAMLANDGEVRSSPTLTDNPGWYLPSQYLTLAIFTVVVSASLRSLGVCSVSG
jgi:hypothetical protein